MSHQKLTQWVFHSCSLVHWWRDLILARHKHCFLLTKLASLCSPDIAALLYLAWKTQLEHLAEVICNTDLWHKGVHLERVSRNLTGGACDGKACGFHSVVFVKPSEDLSYRFTVSSAFSKASVLTHVHRGWVSQSLSVLFVICVIISCDWPFPKQASSENLRDKVNPLQGPKLHCICCGAALTEQIVNQ